MQPVLLGADRDQICLLLRGDGAHMPWLHVHAWLGSDASMAPAHMQRTGCRASVHGSSQCRAVMHAHVHRCACMRLSHAHLGLLALTLRLKVCPTPLAHALPSCAAAAPVRRMRVS